MVKPPFSPHPFPSYGLIQVAGVLDEEEAAMLRDTGVDRIGFPLDLDVHAEDISAEETARIVQSLSLARQAVVITYADTSEEILQLCRRVGVSSVQIHGEIRLEELARLREAAPDLFIMKSLVVTGENEYELRGLINGFSSFVDGFITDTYDPETKASGATGMIHDWRISRRLAALSPRPVILAGGLTPENVRRAVEFVRPAGVDVHTGVEGEDGRKDRGLVREFLVEAKSALARLRR